MKKTISIITIGILVTSAIGVTALDNNNAKMKEPQVKTKDYLYSSMEAFSTWFRQLNKKGLT